MSYDILSVNIQFDDYHFFKQRVEYMYKKVGLLFTVVILSVTLVACGSAKSKAQGKWHVKDDENAVIIIKDDKATVEYMGLTMKGKIVDDDSDSFTIDLDGDKYKGQFINNKLIIDGDEMVKVK